MTVPKSLLLSFFQSAKDSLENCSISEPKSLNEIRSILLSTQRNSIIECLSETSHDPTISADQVEQALRYVSSHSEFTDMQEAMEAMNEAARLAYARLALRSECLQETKRSLSEQMKLNASGAMNREDILEFCGLCNAAVRLPIVQDYLASGKALFPDLPSDQHVQHLRAPVMAPVKRLELIQRKLLQAIGYDADYGSEEIKRIFMAPQVNEFMGNAELINVFSVMASNMNVALTNATILANKKMYSDQEDGGVTRVLSVTYSEKTIDASGIVVPDGVPEGQAMEQQKEDRQKAQLDMARRAMALQEDILQELMSLDENDRDEKLAVARATSSKVIEQAMQKPAGAERVAFLRSVDPTTQRLMTMHKLWETMAIRNGQGNHK